MALKQAFSGLLPRLLNAQGLAPIATQCSHLLAAEPSTSASSSYGGIAGFLRSALAETDPITDLQQQ